MTLHSSFFTRTFWILLVGLVASTGLCPSVALAQVREDCISFDPNRAVVQLVGRSWKIVEGRMWLLDFGRSRSEAEQALRIIQHYGMNSQCFVGRPGPSMEYYLVDGDAPRGPFAGEDSIPFDPERLQVRNVGGRWKIVEGNHYLLDFDKSSEEARTALSIIRTHGFNRICFVGRPSASMTYFRADGCSGLDFTDLALLSTELTINGGGVAYKAGFRDDCDEVDAVLQTWIEQGRSRRAAGGVRIACDAGGTCSQRFTISANDTTSSGSGRLYPGPAVAVFELLKNGRLVAERRLSVELVTEPVVDEPVVDEPIVDDCISFDPDRAVVQLVGGRWKIVEGKKWLLDFGRSRSEAEEALRVIQHYGMNSQCFVGRPDPSMEYYLVDGEAPRGPLAGEDSIPFDPERLQVRLVGGRWKIVEGGHLLLDFGANVEEARTSLEIIQEYGFNRICFVGRPDPSMTYFRVDDGSDDPGDNTVDDGGDDTGHDAGHDDRPVFVRGDVDSDGKLDVSDGMRLIEYMFLGLQEPTCLKVLDTNDSGWLDLSDAVQIFEYLFVAGAPPAAPFPRCGVDPTPDALSCAQVRSCR